MFLTRIGENSRTDRHGDIHADRSSAQVRFWLLSVIPLLTPIREICFTFFEERDVVPTPSSAKIVHAYETAHERVTPVIPVARRGRVAAAAPGAVTAIR